MLGLIFDFLILDYGVSCGLHGRGMNVKVKVYDSFIHKVYFTEKHF